MRRRIHTPPPPSTVLGKLLDRFERWLNRPYEEDRLDRIQARLNQSIVHASQPMAYGSGHHLTPEENAREYAASRLREQIARDGLPNWRKDYRSRPR